MELERLPKIFYYLEIAKAASRRATCLRRHYGVVIVKDDEIVSTGYNGAARGIEDCLERGTCTRKELGIPRGTNYEACLARDTRIMSPAGSHLSIEWFANANAAEFDVYAVDPDTGKFVRTKAERAFKTKDVMQLTRVHFDHGGYVDCTEDHRIMMSNFTYKAASELKLDDLVMGMRYVSVMGCAPHADIVPLRYTHKVTKLEHVDYRGPVYDITVPEYHNFAINLGDMSCIFVHNCRSVHAEANALISAGRKQLIHGTMYLYGWDVEAQQVVRRPNVCIMCRRMIINSGLDQVIYADPDGLAYNKEVGYGYRAENISDWVKAGEPAIEPGKPGY